MRSHIIAVAAAASLATMAGLLAPASAAGRSSVDTKRLLAAGSPANAGQWTSYGRDYSEQRYSPLKQINADNASQLGLAWYGDLAERGGSYETTPVAVDGRIFVTAPWSKVYAFDAKTGKPLWKYDPKVPGEFAVKLCCGIVNRGVALWKGNVIWGTLDGRLVAVNAKSGKKAWEAQVTDPQLTLSITGAPRIADGRIFIGEAGSEFHQRGYIGGLQRRQRQGAVALVDRARRSVEGLRAARARMGREDLERRVVEDRRRRHTVGRHQLRPGHRSACTSARATARRGPRRSARRAVATTCSPRRSSLSMRRPASTAGTTRRRPRTASTSTARSRSSRPISSSTARRSTS